MKLAVSGKGGSGKTTTLALMAKVLSGEGRRVFVLDADPDANLALTLGFPAVDKIVPITRMKELILERTESKESNMGKFFKLNPRVDDLPDQLMFEHEGIKLLHIGTIETAGGGCACPENTFVKTLLMHMMVGRDEAVLVDLPAGIEHLGRGTAMAVDMLVVITEPTPQSVQTQARVKRLAEDLKIKRVAAIGTKVRNEADRDFIRNGSALEVLGFVPFDESLLRGNPGGAPQNVLDEVKGILYKIEGRDESRPA